MLASPATDTAVAVGTSVAAGIALATLAFLCYQWAKDRRERRKQEERNQAARVNCWFTEASNTTCLPNPEVRITGKLEWLNRSDDPVYSVRVAGLLTTKKVYGLPLLKKRQDIASKGGVPMPVIAPGDRGVQEYTWKFNAPATWWTTMEFVLAWQFDDARGVTWLKTSRGHMEKVKPSPQARNQEQARTLSSLEDLSKEVTETTKEVTEGTNKLREIADSLQSGADTSDKSQD